MPLEIRHNKLRISFTESLKKDFLSGEKEGGMLNGSTILQEYGKQ
jgi:hypothetical protein